MHIIKNFPFTKLINTHITRIFETGLIRQWDMEMKHRFGERYLANFRSDFVDLVIVRSPLSMKNMQGGFYLLFIGYAVSIATLMLIERQVGICEKWRNKKKGKRNYNDASYAYTCGIK